jgi:hypothetical protein
VLSPDIPQQCLEQQVTCEDLFHALATNISSVILPKVPLISSKQSSSSQSSSSSVPSHDVAPSPHSPSHSRSLNSSCCSSPTEEYQNLIHHLHQDEDEDEEVEEETSVASDSRHGDDDNSSVETIDAAHDQSHPSRVTNKDQITLPSTPPTMRSTKPPQTKAKTTGRKILHLHGPSRLRSIIGLSHCPNLITLFLTHSTENAVQGVIQECEFENSATPQKHTPVSQPRGNLTEGTHLRLTNPILKRV